MKMPVGILEEEYERRWRREKMRAIDAHRRRMRAERFWRAWPGGLLRAALLAGGAAGIAALGLWALNQ